MRLECYVFSNYDKLALKKWMHLLLCIILFIKGNYFQKIYEPFIELPKKCYAIFRIFKRYFYTIFLLVL